MVIITDRVRSTREGNVLTRVCPSICLSTPGGYPSQVQAGGTPARSDQGVPLPGGYPTSGTPLSDLVGRGTHLRYPPIRPGRGRGYPCWGGTPPWVPHCQTWLGGTPAQGGTLPGTTSGTPIGPGWGVPLLGGTPPHVPPPPNQTWLGGYLCQGGYPTSDGVLDTPRLVCLLRSHRTFLLTLAIKSSNSSNFLFIWVLMWRAQIGILVVSIPVYKPVVASSLRDGRGFKVLLPWNISILFPFSSDKNMSFCSLFDGFIQCLTSKYCQSFCF